MMSNAKKYFLDLGTHFGDGLMKHIRHYNIDESWEVHTFEANPHTYKEFKQVRSQTPEPSEYFKWIKWDNIHYHNKAVWTNNDQIEFYCCSAENSKPLLETSDYFKGFMSELESKVETGEHICLYHNFERPTDGASSIVPPEYMDRSRVNEVQKTFIWKPEDKVIADCFDLSSWILENVKDGDHLLIKMDIEGAEFEVLKKCLNEGAARRINEINIEWHDWFLPHKTFERQQITQYLQFVGVKVGGWV